MARRRPSGSSLPHHRAPRLAEVPTPMSDSGLTARHRGRRLAAFPVNRPRRATPHMHPVAGMRFGRYELLERIGAGGMGEVFRAHDRDLDRDVAVKFLPEQFASDPGRLARFAQEARAASALNHPNIITIHEIGETAGLPYIVMEHVDGQTLRALLRDKRPTVRRA